MILQPFCPGEAMSATFLIGASGATHLIAVGWQKIELKERAITYAGGILPAPAHYALGAVRDAVGCVPGLRGLVGVDFVRDPATAETTVIEINPRPTTSLVGLVELSPPGMIARAWLDAFRGGAWRDDLRGMIPSDPSARLEFRPDGAVLPRGTSDDGGPVGIMAGT
jgi:predicted ATP-grasp superfamily ATP-dependent carboligase